LELGNIYHVIETNSSDELNKYLEHDWRLISAAVHGDIDGLGIKSQFTVYSVGCTKDQYEFYKKNPKDFEDPNSYKLPF